MIAAFLVNFAALIIHIYSRPLVNRKLDKTQAYSLLTQVLLANSVQPNIYSLMFEALSIKHKCFGCEIRTCISCKSNASPMFSIESSHIIHYALPFSHMLTRNAFSMMCCGAFQTVTIFYSIILFLNKFSEDQLDSGGAFFAQITVLVVNCLVTVFPWINYITSKIQHFLKNTKLPPNDEAIAPTLSRIPFHR